MRRVDRGFEIVGRTILVVFLCLIFLGWLTERQVLRFDRITVSGTHAVDSYAAGTIARNNIAGAWVWRWFYKDNAVLYPRRAIVRGIKDLSSWVRDVSGDVTRKVLAISIYEYVPAYIWCDDTKYADATSTPETCWFASAQGEVFAHSPIYAGYPFIRIISNRSGVAGPNDVPLILPPSQFDRIIAFASELENAGYTVRSIVHLGENDFRFVVDRPWSILWSSDKDPKESVRNLSAAIQTISNDIASKSTVNEIDLRFGDKIFTR